MFFALLLTILPTLLAYIIITKADIVIENKYFKIALSWFIGQYLFTILAFLIATGLSSLTTGVLLKSSLLVLLMTGCALFFLRKWTLVIVQQFLLKENIKLFFHPTNILLILFCLIFSYIFFIPHLSYQNGVIARSPIYWDYHWQMSLIQNFVHGDNFPPENEAFAGIPANYHYFWMVNTGIYQSLGLNAVDAINFTSIIQFFFLLLILVGIAIEFFGSKLAGFFAVLLSITSSSLHFIDYFRRFTFNTVLEAVTKIFTTTEHPWNISLFRDLHFFVYNGTFFNLFYFIEERQMIPAVIFMLISIWVINERRQFSSILIFVIGLLMGSFFLWHLHVTLMVLCAILFSLILGSERKKTLFLLFGFCIAFVPHLLFFKNLTHTEWFVPQTTEFPKINFGFADQENKPYSLYHAVIWYSYSYGLKVLLLPLGLLVIFTKYRKYALGIIAVVVPTFLLVNTIQLSPNSIYENHKFLRPMNFAIDLTAGFVISFLFFQKRQALLKILGVLVLVAVTASGIIELMPFINSKPSQGVAKYPSELTYAIRTNTPSKSVFVGNDEYDIYLAGRKLFLAKEQRGHDDVALDKKKRQKVISDLYDASDMTVFCRLTRGYNIDFVEFNNAAAPAVPEYLKNAIYFPALNAKGEQLIFVNTRKTCDS
jgi:hypothetical protein